MVNRRNVLIGIGSALGVAVIVLGAVVVVGLVRKGDLDRDWEHGAGRAAAGPATMDRAAAILGVEPEAMQAAVAEARRQRADEIYKARLDRMVEEGRLTEEEAASQYEWFRNRPDDSSRRAGWGHDNDGPHKGGQFLSLIHI